MRRASLNLSVNAIIIFVLAFAMLGVGMYVTSQLRDTASTGLARAREIIGNIEEEPTAEKPLVGVSQEMDIPANKREPYGVKYYNKDRERLNATIVVIDNCKSTSDGSIIKKEGDSGYPVNIVSDTVTIEPSTYKSIPFTVQNDKLQGGETYICKLKLISENTEAVYYSHSFYLNVRS